MTPIFCSTIIETLFESKVCSLYYMNVNILVEIYQPKFGSDQDTPHNICNYIFFIKYQCNIVYIATTIDVYVIIVVNHE